MYAEDMFNPNEAVLNPPLDTRATAQWQLIGYLRARNALFDSQTLGLGDNVFFGFVAQSKTKPATFIVVVRGTELPVEWVENFEAVLVPHRLVGKVEQGFFSIYDSMQYVSALAGAVPQPAAGGIRQVLPNNADLTVIGHSLGAAVATYLMLDLAQGNPGYNVAGALIASPLPGDRDFTDRVDADVPQYTLYNYILDAVPHVPLCLPPLADFHSLSKATWITPSSAQARIRFEVACNHHAYCYAAMLDFSSIQGGTVNTPCVLGSNG